ncbi:hypothetical protein F5051DRAFT_455542 [Lentinula edodes]|nr:hypothetical protein F5051DRAFT_455542 [Lentinula edodes]
MDMIILHLVSPLCWPKDISSAWPFACSISEAACSSICVLYHPCNRLSKMRFIGVYLFLALVSVGFAVPLSADKDAERSLNLQAASRVDSGPFGTRNFYDTSDDEEENATKQEKPKKQPELNQVQPDAKNQKNAFSKWKPSWMGSKKGGDNAKNKKGENGEGSK